MANKKVTYMSCLAVVIAFGVSAKPVLTEKKAKDREDKPMEYKFIFEGRDHPEPNGLTSLLLWYNVFSREPTEEDKNAEQMLKAELSNANAGEPFMGDDAMRDIEIGVKRVEGGGRVLMRGVIGESDVFFARPTEDGTVCYVVPTTMGESCASPDREGTVLTWDQMPPDSLAVYGMVRNDVVAVDVVVKGKSYPAQMGENSFAVEVSGVENAWPNEVVLYHQDGTTTHRDPMVTIF
jgi:hypothetical protein